MRLIDADALQDAIHKSAPVIPEFSRIYTRDRVDFEIAIAQEIDAVPIVRCKDCIWYNTTCSVDGSGICERSGMDFDTSDSFYCANGQKQ